MIADECTFNIEEDAATNATASEGNGTSVAIVSTATIQKVECDVSPFFYAFYEHHVCHVVLDSGATSTVVSRSFLQVAGITANSTAHSARGADKKPLDVQGEVHITLHFNGIDLPLTALVIDKLDCDVLAGIPFMKVNKIMIDFESELICLRQLKIAYGARSRQEVSSIRIAESFILKNDSAQVVMPGEFIEVHSKDLEHFDGEVSIEPRIESPRNGLWPERSLTRVIQGSVRIPNLGDEPLVLKRSQQFAQIRRVTAPMSDVSSGQPQPKKSHVSEGSPSLENYSGRVTVDPDGQLTVKDRQAFEAINNRYDSVFSTTFGLYNDNSGPLRAHVHIGPVEPPPMKGKLPLYSHNNMQQLQEEADKLEAQGVLAKPEDLGIQVKFVSPSFLVTKPNGEFRFVTAFNNLGMYTRILPTAGKSCDAVLRRLSSFQYIIKTDFTKSFFQIRLAKSSMPYVSTVTPFKGLRVYTRPAMGMPGSSEYLQELTSRVLGDYVQAGFVVLIDDDLNIGANTIQDLINKWTLVLARLQENGLTLSAPKTVICPKTVTILGWTWSEGKLTACTHKLSALISVPPPKTCTAMRSFIGAFKAVSRCFPKYASLMSPLEDALKGLEGKDSIVWSDELLKQFKEVQTILKSPAILTIPIKSDHLIMTVDASPVNKGLGATLYVQRNKNRHLAEFFSFKLKNHQINWYPCEMEALAISAAVNHFGPYINESQNQLQVFTDSKPCVQAFQRLCKGQFSASARVSTFLATLSSYPVNIAHIPGKANSSSDYSSRHPAQCDAEDCQICKFVESTAESVVVNAVSVNDILSGTAPMPFLNKNAWRSAQHACGDLRRVYAHLTQGTRPSKKSKNLRNLRRYLNEATIDNQGLIVVKKQEPGHPPRTMIVVPVDILPGIINALHLSLKHATKHQLKLLFSRYFFGIKSVDVISQVVDECQLCNSMKAIPAEVFKQSPTKSPSSPGCIFFADVLRRCRQKVCVVRDVHSSYTTASFVPDETAQSLKTALLISTSMLRGPECKVRIDTASGFNSLRHDTSLQDYGIELDFGYVKNKNSNCV